MSKVFQATCVSGVVTSQGVAVVGCEILSKGVESSSGILIQDELKAYYLPNATDDLKALIEKMITALTQTSSALTSLDTAHFLLSATGGVPSTPLATSAISAIDSVKADLQTFKEALK